MTSRSVEIVATGIVPTTPVPAKVSGAIVTGGDQGAVNQLHLVDGSGGPIVCYIKALANTTADLHFDAPIYCANGIYVESFSNTGNSHVSVRYH